MSCLIMKHLHEAEVLLGLHLAGRRGLYKRDYNADESCRSVCRSSFSQEFREIAMDYA